MILRGTTRAAALALTLLLGACGGGSGGGVNSTPTPGPGPSPTPTPTPTTGANDDLIAPLASESFRNAASVGTVSAPTSGAAVSTSAAAALAATVSYNASNQSYTISDGTNTRTFGPGDVDASQTNAALTTYKITSGNTTDFLSLTKTGSGGGQTRYVAGGFWQRQVNGSATVDGRFLAFAYGVATPDGALPRSGVASFDVKMLGARTFSTNIYALAGTGILNVDFQTGAIAADGFYEETNSATGMRSAGYGWKAYALLSSTANSFAGTLRLDTAGAGELHGAMFGPGAEEVGGAFSIKSGSDVAAVGTIYGARGTNPLQSTNLALADKDTFYRSLGKSVKGQLNGAGVLSSIASAPGAVAVYREENGVGYTVYNADGRINTPFPGETTLSYEILGGTLSYTRGGMQLDRRANTGQLDAYVYGFDTTAAQLPRIGSASFAVQLHGGVAASGTNFRSLFGTGSLNADFATGVINTIGGYSVTDRLPGTGNYSLTTFDTGSWSGNGTISSTSNSFAGTLALDGATDFNGSMSGKFFGPAAEEVGAAFEVDATNGAKAVGVLIGGQGASTAGSQTPLKDLTSATTLQGVDVQTYTSLGSSTRMQLIDGRIEVTFDPIAKTYQLVSKTTGVNTGDAPLLDKVLAAADRDVSASDEKFDAFRTSSFTARVLKIGASNPLITLSYTSFAQITETATVNGRQITSTHFVPFGGQTPGFQMPKTGTATYSGIALGTGYDGVLKGNANLSGTSVLNVNFGTSEVGMNLSLMSTKIDGGQARDLGTISYSGEIRNSSDFFLSIPTSPYYFSYVEGKFFGANAAEFGAGFSININPEQGTFDHTSNFAGVAVGKKD